MTTKRNFFDLLALADVERVHSAVIGWLFSDECEALTREERSKVLNELFGLPHDRAIYKTSKMHLEWENIDILWETETFDGVKECWILENKIKSSQHHYQLDTYEKIINGETCRCKDSDKSDHNCESRQRYKDYPKETKHYCFLTVIGELAKSANGNYHNTTYTQLVKSLEPNFSVEASARNTDWIMANEYFKAIQEMTRVTKAFLDNPTNFPRVFLDGNKGMQVKLDSYKDKNLTEDEMYIAQRGMETLMQKYYLFDVIKEVIDSLNDPQINWWHVGETRGNADMGFHFENYIDRHDGKDYHFDISFQAGTFKFAVSYKYREAESRDLKVRQEFINKWEDIFLALKLKYKCTQINRGKSLSRISICYPIVSGRKWYELSRVDFVASVKKEIQKAIQMKAEAIEEYEQ